MAFQSLFSTTLAARAGASDTTLTLASAPTITAGRVRLFNSSVSELCSFSGVSGNQLTGVGRNLSKTADPSTVGGVGYVWPAGTKAEIVLMHDQILDKQNANQLGAMIAPPTYANDAAADAAWPGGTAPNGAFFYSTASGSVRYKESGVWTGGPGAGDWASTRSITSASAANGELYRETTDSFSLYYKRNGGTAVKLYDETNGYIPQSVIQQVLPEINLRTVTAYASESIASGNSVGYESVWPTPAEVVNNLALGDASARTRRAYRFIADGRSVTSIKLKLLKVGSPTDNFQVRVETDNSNSPSGTLVNTNASANVAGTGLTTSLVDTTVTFTGVFTPTAGQVCWLVLQRVNAVDPVNYYGVGYMPMTTRAFPYKEYNGTSYGAEIATSLLYVGDATGNLIAKNVLSKTSASWFNLTRHVGFATSAYSAGELARVQSGLVNFLSGLTVGSLYYLSNTAGAIGTSAGTIPQYVGTALSSTTLDTFFEAQNASIMREAMNGLGGFVPAVVAKDAYGQTINPAGTSITAFNKGGGTFQNAVLAQSLAIVCNFPYPQQFDVSFGMSCNNGYTGQGQIYINGVPVGTLRSVSSPTPTTFDEAILVRPGDSIQLWTYISNTGAAATTISNFSVKYSLTDNLQTFIASKFA